MTEKQIQKFIEDETAGKCHNKADIVNYINNMSTMVKIELNARITSYSFFWARLSSFGNPDSPIWEISDCCWPYDFHRDIENIIEKLDKKVIRPDKAIEWLKGLSKLLEEYGHFERLTEFAKSLTDSPKLHFTGNIIITEPNLIFINYPYEDERNGRRRAQELGIENYLVHGTVCGETSYQIKNKLTNDIFDGYISIDGAQVGIFYKNDYKKLYPKFDGHNSVCINNFDGDVQIKVNKCKSSYTGFRCYITGKGINTKTGEPIEFCSEGGK